MATISMPGWQYGGILSGAGQPGAGAGAGHPPITNPSTGPVTPSAPVMGNSPTPSPSHPQGIGSGYNVLAALSQVTGMPIEALIARGFK